MLMKPKNWDLRFIVQWIQTAVFYIIVYLLDPGNDHKDLIIFDETKKYAESIVLKLIEVLDNRQRNICFDDGILQLS